MSIKIMNWVWENSPYDGTSLLVHLKLADHANDEGYCYPTQVGLARGARCTDRHVRNVLKQMATDGYIEVVPSSVSGRKNNAYFLRNPSSTGKDFRRNPSSGGTGNPLPDNHHVTTIKTAPARCPGCQRRHDPREGCF